MPVKLKDAFLLNDMDAINEELNKIKIFIEQENKKLC